MRSIVAMPLLLAAAACSGWFFSGVHYPSEERPVVRIETQKGVELGAATTEGILFLGRTAQSGPCRVMYFLGPTPLEESGVIVPAGGVYYRADIQLKHQTAPLLDREPEPGDELFAMLFAGRDVVTVPVQLARGDGMSGSLLESVGRPLPAGTPVFARIDDAWHLVGLIAGRATLERGGRQEELLVYAGMDALREMLQTPTVHPPPKHVVFRPDDIWVMREDRTPPPEPPSALPPGTHERQTPPPADEARTGETPTTTPGAQRPEPAGGGETPPREGAGRGDGRR